MRRIFLILFSATLLFVSCNRQAKSYPDTPTSGVITISADETFAPVLDQEIDIFEFQYPEAHIIPIYTDEVEAMNLLLSDSVRMTIATRDLTEKEKNSIRQQKHLIPRTVHIATDGVALIINKKNTDSLLTVWQLRDILMGKITSWKQLSPKSKLNDLSLVFDNKNSSTVRFAIDSICNGEPLGTKNIFAQGDNAKVIDYVSQTPGAIGVIGASWIGNKNDSTNMTFSDRVNVVGLSRDEFANPANSYKPYQAYIAQGLY
ncbi:MAG: substrate-binding domain-containing protein, partial [Bacteroidales bacterium]